MRSDHERQAKGKRIMAEIVAIPAILAFPPEVYAQLDQLCELRGFTHHQLVGEALRSQEGRWLKLGKELLTQRPTGEIEAWPEDPLEILARVVWSVACSFSAKTTTTRSDTRKRRRTHRLNGLSARRKI